MKQASKYLLYAALGFLPPFIEKLQAITPETLSGMIWSNWAILILAPLYSMLLTLKALMSPTEDLSNGKG